VVDRALVLGGGGLTAFAWQVGMVAGLAEEGVSLGDADLFAGTSAGALLAVELAAGAAPAGLRTACADGARAMPELHFTLGMTVKYLWAALVRRDPEAVRRRLGKLALAVRDVPESEVLDTMRPLLPVRTWPDRPLRLFAVDALTGEPAGFSAGSGIDLVRAVAASGALPPLFPPVTIGRGRWVDGGVRSTTNADLMNDCRRVVVLAPISKSPGASPSVGEQVASLRADGVRTALLVPDDASRRALGRNPLDPSRIPGAAGAGHRQAAALAERVRAVWHG
jgi:NTE family protein